MAAQTSSRKQWRLFRGPKGNIQSLGWAEFGCPESQVKLAKELLEDNGEENVEKEERSRLGVYWLLKASEKGHEEATRMLQECLDNGVGITEHNLSDVRGCLSMPKEEKLSREAAKELFTSLSQGENYITSNQLFRETLKYSEGPVPLEAGVSQEWSLYESDALERLTEEMVVACGSQHLVGELPAVLNRPPIRSSILALTTVHLARLGPLFKPIYLLVILTLLGVRFVLEAAPSILYYSSLVAMVLASSQILSKKWEFIHFQRWSYALVACGCSDEVSAQAQRNHCTKNIRPFLNFILSLIINILSSSTVPEPPLSEIATLSTIIALYMLYNLVWRNKKLDGLVLLTFIIHLVARYPYEIDSFVYHYWRYLDVHVPTFTSLAVGSSIEFCLNFRVLLYLLLPGFFLRIAARDRWLGTFTTLLPHLVCLAWWQMAVLASNGATYFGIIRSCLGLVLFILFLPLCGISMLLVPLLTVGRFFLNQQISMPLALAGICFTLFIYVGSRYKRKSNFFSFVQVLLCVLSVFFILHSFEVERVKKIDLSWKDLKGVCMEEGLLEQEKCASFIGLQVLWEGQVISSKISSVHNPLEHIITFLPQDLQSYVVCVLGEYHESCTNPSDCTPIKRCTLSNWNRFEYEITVRLRDVSTGEGSVGRLKGGPNFRNFTFGVKPNDHISFSGILSGQDSGRPHVTLTHAKCFSCPQEDSFEVHQYPSSRQFLDKLIDFIFYPISNLRD